MGEPVPPPALAQPRIAATRSSSSAGSFPPAGGGKLLPGALEPLPGLRLGVADLHQRLEEALVRGSWRTRNCGVRNCGMAAAGAVPSQAVDPRPHLEADLGDARQLFHLELEIPSLVWLM
ncbi:MAG: hypothetical protein HY717_06055 [Planctomycetes bacterium]|nr:hypothetical protein [Planctomycetota bacterium]